MQSYKGKSPNKKRNYLVFCCLKKIKKNKTKNLDAVFLLLEIK